MIITLSSCCSKKINSENTANNQVTICPKDGKCTFEVLKNKAIVSNTDFGKINYTLVEDSLKDVVRYQYTKDLDKSNIDAGYREEILFEIDSNNSNTNFVNSDLEKTKMLFGRYCYCRGQTGLYKVVNGNLKIINFENLSFQLNFKISEVPQVVNTIIVADGKL